MSISPKTGNGMMGIFGFLASGASSGGLMHRMMQALGVDRQLKHLPGHGAVETRATERCSHCEHETECAGWLAANENANPDEPPEFCANRDLIARLSKLPPTP
jgi:hypothetical protein